MLTSSLSSYRHSRALFVVVFSNLAASMQMVEALEMEDKVTQSSSVYELERPLILFLWLLRAV